MNLPCRLSGPIWPGFRIVISPERVGARAAGANEGSGGEEQTEHRKLTPISDLRTLRVGALGSHVTVLPFRCGTPRCTESWLRSSAASSAAMLLLSLFAPPSVVSLRSTEQLNRIANRAIKVGRHQDALKCYETALTSGSDPCRTPLLHALHLQRMQRPSAQVRAAFSQGAFIDRGNPRLLAELLIAWGLFESKQAEMGRAVRLLRRAVHLDASKSDVLRWRMFRTALDAQQRGDRERAGARAPPRVAATMEARRRPRSPCAARRCGTRCRSRTSAGAGGPSATRTRRSGTTRRACARARRATTGASRSTSDAPRRDARHRLARRRRLGRRAARGVRGARVPDGDRRRSATASSSARGRRSPRRARASPPPETAAGCARPRS